MCQIGQRPRLTARARPAPRRPSTTRPSPPAQARLRSSPPPRSCQASHPATARPGTAPHRPSSALAPPDACPPADARARSRARRQATKPANRAVCAPLRDPAQDLARNAVRQRQPLDRTHLLGPRNLSPAAPASHQLPHRRRGRRTTAPADPVAGPDLTDAPRRADTTNSSDARHAQQQRIQSHQKESASARRHPLNAYEMGLCGKHHTTTLTASMKTASPAAIASSALFLIQYRTDAVNNEISSGNP